VSVTPFVPVVETLVTGVFRSPATLRVDVDRWSHGAGVVRW
jgi:hypothetical protein